MSDAPDMVYKYDVITGRETIEEHRGHHLRNTAMKQLLRMATYYAGSFRKSFEMGVYTTDFPPAECDIPHIVPCHNNKHNPWRIVAPDFAFYHWVDANMPPYSELVNDIIETSRQPVVSDKLFWIGNIDTHPTRQKLYEKFYQHPLMDIRSMVWTDLSNFVLLKDHCQFKYLIDLQGYGYSGRLKMLMFSGRPLLVQDRFHQEWFQPLMKPFVHYVPVKEDLSDLEKQLVWTIEHPEEADAIAKEAQKFAMKNLTQTAAVMEMAACLKRASTMSGHPLIGKSESGAKTS